MEHHGQTFLSFWTKFCTSTLLTILKIKMLKKMKTATGDTIILHMCTINDNHMVYGFWDMERDWHNFLWFWTIFWPFNTLTTKKIKVLKKGEKTLEISLFYTCVPQMIIKWCIVPNIWSRTKIIFCHFGASVVLWAPSQLKILKF